jgi:TetR/AcrR family acrAB operon transcriptional repressor
MARRTKEEALETRNHILDTAEFVFREKGVARTSLADIAEAAGVTRGAIYWHFENKEDLFQAMCDRVSLPLEALFQSLTEGHPTDPLGQLRETCIQLMRHTATDPQCRRVFEILSYKCEYVEELEPTVQRRLECRYQGVSILEQSLRHAIAKGQLPGFLDPRRAAIGLFAYMDGLIYNWGMDPESFSLAEEAGPLIDIYLAGLKAHKDYSERYRENTQ